MAYFSITLFNIIMLKFSLLLFYKIKILKPNYKVYIFKNIALINAYWFIKC